MDFSYPDDVRAFRRELSSFLEAAVTPEMRSAFAAGWRDHSGPTAKALWRQLGAEGYLGVSFPVEYGGGGKSPLYHHALCYEMAYRGLPFPTPTLNNVAPALLRFGSEAQKRRFLPPMISGEMEFAIGYTEPQGGTDIASIRTQAVRVGDSYIINGQKAFTSRAHHADYVWMAVRTRPEGPRHDDLSILVVRLDAEGIDIRPLYTMGNIRTNVTFYDNVTVPADALVGEENRGWQYIMTGMNFERIAISPVAEIEAMFDWLRQVAWHHDSGTHGAWTQVTMVSMAADLNALKVMDMRVASMVAEGKVPTWEASLLKVLSNELRVKLTHDALQMTGPAGFIRHGSPGALLTDSEDTVERQLRWSVTNLFGAGSNDIHREIIAKQGLGLAEVAFA